LRGLLLRGKRGKGSGAEGGREGKGERRGRKGQKGREVGAREKCETYGPQGSQSAPAIVTR